MSVLTKFRKLARKRDASKRVHAHGSSNGIPEHDINYNRRSTGYLTHEDVEKLEEASKRVLKYKKQFAQKFKCNACHYEWLYSAVRCPVCSTTEIKKIA
ncbi:MAG TPA: hypothetical protein VI968_02670 [archaeon]|nr:hypothetical protein [archaeon]